MHGVFASGRPFLCVEVRIKCGMFGEYGLEENYVFGVPELFWRPAGILETRPIPMHRSGRSRTVC